MNLNTETIKNFFDHASSYQFRLLMSEMDKMQDIQDRRNGKHITIPLTVAIMAELIYRSEVKIQEKKGDCE
jgi:hypothetical protein